MRYGQYYNLKELLPGRDPVDGSHRPDSKLADAIALDAAQPWLGIAVPAPPWFGTGGATSLRVSGLNAAKYGFVSAPAWGLAGRSEAAAEAAAGPSPTAAPERFPLTTLHTEQAERIKKLLPNIPWPQARRMTLDRSRRSFKREKS